MEFDASEATFLDQALVRHQTTEHVPLLSTAVAHNGEIVFERYLSSDVSQSLDADTQFRIASMTKSFTAVLVSKAVEAKLIDSLDDPIELYVPQLGAIDYLNEDDPAITIRHLLYHQAGFVYDDPWGDNQLDMTDDAFSALMQQELHLASTPGTRFEYSNTGYAILGRLISNVYGHDFHHVTKRELIEPLGMERTSWQPLDNNYARPYNVEDEIVVAEPSPLGNGAFDAMAGLWSTPRDILKWAQFFLDAENPHLVNDDYDHILTAASRRASQHVGTEVGQLLIKPRPTVDGVEPGGYIAAPIGYARGLRVWHDHVLGRTVGHSGGLPGYGSHMRWFTQENFAIASLGNLRYTATSTPVQETMNEISRRSIGLTNGYEVPVARELAGLAQSLVDIVNVWDDALAQQIFADNVPLDESYQRRATQAAKIIEATGMLEIQSITATSRSSAKIVAAGPRGKAAIELARSPRRTPEIQYYELTLIEPDAAS